MIGKIIKLTGGFYYIESQNKIYTSRARGLFRHKDQSPLVGDDVEFSEGEDLGYIEKILPRKNILKRPAVANVDQVLLMLSLKNPNYNLQLTDHMLALYEGQNVKIIMCLNKYDLDPKAGDELKEIYKNVVDKVIITSLKNDYGLDDVRELLKGKLTALCGVSGAGKSTLASKILNKNLEMGSVSNKTSRGKHTTRHVELHYCDDIYIFDTPGFSSIDIMDIEKENLSHHFREFNKFLPCKFNDCRHINEPGCKIKEALANNQIAKSRYDSYLSAYKEIENKKR